MTAKKNEALSLNVTEGLQVTILPSKDHEFLMSTEEVAKGYNVSYGNIREHKRVNDEFSTGKHFIVGVRISDSDPHNKVYWTKRGIVRLGFFIKSERAKLFRDWAEDLILEKIEKGPIQDQQKIDSSEKLLKVILNLKDQQERNAVYDAFKELKSELDIYKHTNRVYLLAEKGRILKKLPKNRTQQEQLVLNRALQINKIAEA